MKFVNDPASAGFDAGRLADAIAFAEAHESAWPRDMYVDGIYIGSADVNDKPPYNVPMGPVFPRGGPNGLLLRHGELVAEWGDPDRRDLTFSVAKSYLGLLAGIALDRGLIGSIDDPVALTVRDGGFDDPHNAAITWRNFLEQTSEWSGTLFDRPDSVDWLRSAGTANTTDANAIKGGDRERRRPGTYFEYNDVRVNRLALSLLRVLREPLPDVLARNIMGPLGSLNEWRWYGYDTSWVDLDGARVQSVSGGSHWGGGMQIASRDHARLGELVRNHGRAGDRQLVSSGWIAAMLTPSANNPNYGLLWWLNTGRSLHPAAPESSVFALGGGSNLVWVDRPLGLVMVARWIAKPRVGELIGRVMVSVKG